MTNPGFRKKSSDGLEGLKKLQKWPKNEIYTVFSKILSIQICFFLLQHKSTNVILTFCKKNMFGKNLVLELWPKYLKNNQNAEFFKLQYRTKNLKYKVELLDVTTLMGLIFA